MFVIRIPSSADGRGDARNCRAAASGPSKTGRAMLNYDAHVLAYRCRAPGRGEQHLSIRLERPGPILVARTKDVLAGTQKAKVTA